MGTACKATDQAVAQGFKPINAFSEFCSTPSLSPPPQQQQYHSILCHFQLHGLKHILFHDHKELIGSLLKSSIVYRV